MPRLSRFNWEPTVSTQKGWRRILLKLGRKTRLFRPNSRSRGLPYLEGGISLFGCWSEKGAGVVCCIYYLLLKKTKKNFMFVFFIHRQVINISYINASDARIKEERKWDAKTSSFFLIIHSKRFTTMQISIQISIQISMDHLCFHYAYPKPGLSFLFLFFFLLSCSPCPSLPICHLFYFPSHL